MTHSRYLLCVTFIIAIALITGSPLRTTILADDTSSRSLLYRQDLVPQALIESEAKGLIPIRRSEFDELLKTIKLQTEQQSPQGYIPHIQCNANWSNSTLTGKAIAKIVTMPGKVNRLSLGNTNLEIKNCHWTHNANERVIIGRNKNADVELIAERTGDISWDWELPGKKNIWGVQRFEIKLPHAVGLTWNIKMPAALHLEASAGIVSVISRNKKETEWEWKIGGGTTAILEIFDSSIQKNPARMLIRDDVSCMVRPGELEVRYDLVIDVYRHSVTQLKFQTQGNWHVLKAQSGDKSIPLRFTEENGKEIGVLHFDTPLSGTNCKITLSGSETISENQTLTAPRLKILEGTWLSGKTRFQIESPVRVTSWKNDQVKWLVVDNKTINNARNIFDWSYVTEQGVLQYTVQRQPYVTQVHSGTHVTFERDALSARIIADLQADRRGVFTWEANVRPGWILDTVTTEPVDVLESWEILTRSTGPYLKLHLRSSWNPLFE
jgi:hypothetical protein